MQSVARTLAVLLIAGCAAAPPPVTTSESPLVDIAAIEPGIRVDIRYATADNFLKTAVYPVNCCLLRPETAQRLARAHRALQRQGLGIKVWDCYRPLSVQKKLWALKPDPAFVAPPERGSRHNRGAAVDVTLVDAAGRELEMPTGYDEFTERAHREYKLSTPAARAHLEALDAAMTGAGFIGLKEEWWHYDDPDWERHPLLDIPLR